MFFVYENEPSTTFNLKNYLLVLAKIHCNPTAICYCENKQDTQNTDTKEIKFLLINSTFEKYMESIKSHYKRFRETFLLDYSETIPSETINKLKARVIEERD